MSDQLAEIEARADAATPGPWDHQSDTFAGTRPVHRIGNVRENCDVGLTYRDYHTGEANAEFITRSREDIPWLINRVRELEAQNRRMAGIPGIRTIRVHEEVAASITEAHVGWHVPHVGALAEIADVAEHPGRVVLHIEGEGWADELVFHLGDPVLLVEPGEVSA